MFGNRVIWELALLDLLRYGVWLGAHLSDHSSSATDSSRWKCEANRAWSAFNWKYVILNCSTFGNSRHLDSAAGGVCDSCSQCQREITVVYSQADLSGLHRGIRNKRAPFCCFILRRVCDLVPQIDSIKEILAVTSHLASLFYWPVLNSKGCI